MPLIYLEDGTTLQFDTNKYENIKCMGMKCVFVLKPEYASNNRPSRIVLDGFEKTYYEEFDGHYKRTLNYNMVI